MRLTSYAWRYPPPSRFAIRIDALDLRRGGLVYLRGPSGCGKTTLLNLLAGVVDDAALSRERRRTLPRVAYVMHQSGLPPWLSLDATVRLEERLRGGSIDRPLFDALLDEFGLARALLRERRPRDLSFGMRQRFEVAKALAFVPDLLLLDEAFSGIDERTRETTVAAVARIARTRGIAVVFTSHNLVDGLRVADRIVEVDDGCFAPARDLETSFETRARLSVDQLLASVGGLAGSSAAPVGFPRPAA